MDSFFSKGFKAAKCKTLLKLTIPRLKLLRNRREIQIKQMRREIAKLLETGQEATARIRVEHIIREEKMMGAQEIVELFCELITVRLPIIEAQRDCPLDLKEAISSVCFAAPRCADLPELLQVQMLFAGKYSREFVSSATELMPECGVNRQLIELLSIRPPAPDVKLKLLKEIAEEHELEWDPSASKSELFKTHEDLLNGSKVPLPEPQHDNATVDELSDSDEDFDIIDFSEVPSQPLQAKKKGRVSTPVMMPFPASALSDDDDHEEPIPSLINEDVSKVGDKQFLPFIHPPSQSIPVRELSPPPSITDTENENVGLEDVLAAALEAAETAERAAAAARSAASLAQLRISELMRKKNDEVLSSSDENPFHLDKSKPWQEENEDQVSLGDGRGPFTSPSYDDSNEDFDSSPHSNCSFSHGSHHKPQRLHSMDDETCFSYPNLFTSQGSNPTPHVQSFRDSK